MSRNFEKNTEIDNIVCRNLKKYRLLLGVKQRELAIAIGVTPQQIQKYENCTNRISCGKLFNIANLLKLPLNLFFSKN